MLEAEDDQVFGEAMTFPDLDAVLKGTDLLEGYDPRRPDCSMYRRVVVPALIVLSGRRIMAWTYVWNRALPQGATMLAKGCWGDHWRG
jgi:hypothetical protein